MNVFLKPTTRLLRLVLFCALVACLVPPTPVSADSQSWRLLENNNRLLGEQGGGGDAEEAGAVRITYYGHMAFKITSPQGLEVLVDPWRNDPSGAWGLWFPKPFPEIAVDIVLSTHAHFDHDAVYRPHAISVLERLAGRYEIGDLRVLGLADKHVCHAPGWYKWDLAADEVDQDFCPPDNPLHMDNFIQVIETGGLRIAHWGDNRPQPAPYADDELQGVDVLILPIDESAHLLSEADIGDIIAPATRGQHSAAVPTGGPFRSRQSTPVRLRGRRRGRPSASGVATRWYRNSNGFESEDSYRGAMCLVNRR